MKLFKNLKKGFTLIELVVVIAVIAILSAVSVVSYVAITNKAKTSSDEQAVTQMNTILTANEVMDLRSIRDVLDAFAENGLDAEDYKPLMKDRYFFWDADENKIIYTDENYKVLFPESLKEKSKEGAHWLSLSGKINERDYSSNLSNGSGTITGTATEAGEKLYKLAQDVKSGSNTALKGSEEKIISLPEKVDLAGSEFNLGTVKNLTLKGDQANKTEIDNFFTSEYQNLGSQGNRKTRAYHAGLIQTVEGNVTFENLKIKNVTIGDYDVSMSAIFAGQVTSGSVLTIKNCTIEDAYIYGEQKVAAVAAYITGGKIVMENCTFTNVHIYSEEGCAGGVTGYADASSIFDIKSPVVESIKNNVTCELTKVSDRLYKTVDVSLTDASNEVVSTFNSYTDRTAEFGKTGRPELNGKRRFKPGCATFGWIADSIIAPEGADYYVDYGLKPLHSSDMVK